MKFEQYLEENKIDLHSSYYIDYGMLKKLIYKASFSESDESNFVHRLDNAIGNTFDYINKKQKEYSKRISEYEKLSKDTFVRSESAISENNLHLKRDVVNLKRDVEGFSAFIRLNIIGLSRIVKLHDRKTRFKLNHEYKSRIRNRIRCINDIDDFIYRLSKTVLYLRGEKQKKSEIDPNKIIRKTTKYWIHRENLLQVKCKILQHLPVYVFANKSNVKTHKATNIESTGGDESTALGILSSPYAYWNSRTHDINISSVYLDNDNFDLYNGRLEKRHLAEAIRVRWYTSKPQDIVFIERKLHEDGWTGEKSKKLRFKINENNVNAYLRGEDVWENVKSINTGDMDELRTLYLEIQKSIVEKKLEPYVRTYYKRTAFQLPDTADVRISLDTHLCMIKEKVDKPYLAKNWRRNDINCDYPFTYLSSEDIVRFPYGILEVKIQTYDGNPPEWVNELVNSNLVEHIHKFSKYIHGTSILYPSVEQIPYWLPQMGTDIRKEVYGTPLPVRRDFHNGNLIEIPKQSYTPDEDMLLTGNSNQNRTFNIDAKKIAIPVRIEPKVFFANERTFLSWLQFSIFIGGIGTAMMGLGDHRAVYIGVIFIGVSILFALYALYLYFWRAFKIRGREPGPYDDLYGPAVLVFVFLAAMMFSIIFKAPFK